MRNSMDHFPRETDITGENYFNYGLKVWWLSHEDSRGEETFIQENLLKLSKNSEDLQHLHHNRLLPLCIRTFLPHNPPSPAHFDGSSGQVWPGRQDFLSSQLPNKGQVQWKEALSKVWLAKNTGAPIVHTSAHSGQRLPLGRGQLRRSEAAYHSNPAPRVLAKRFSPGDKAVHKNREIWHSLQRNWLYSKQCRQVQV